MNRLMPRSRGAELAMLLLKGFHAMTDEVIVQLEARGYKGVRAVHAFALEAIDAGAETTSEVGRKLSVSKQAAAKTIAVLQQLGYVASDVDPDDARRKKLQITSLGCELIAVGSALFDDVRDRWAAQMGATQLDVFEEHLARSVGRRSLNVDDLARFDKDQGEEAI